MERSRRPGRPLPLCPSHQRLSPERWHGMYTTAVPSSSAYNFRFFLLVLRFRFYRLVYGYSVYSDHSVHSVRGACGIHHARSLLSHFPCADDYSLPSVLRLPPIRLRAFSVCRSGLSLCLTAVRSQYSLAPSRPCSRVPYPTCDGSLAWRLLCSAFSEV